MTTREDRLSEIDHYFNYEYMVTSHHPHANWLINSLRAAWAREAKLREALEFYSDDSGYTCVCQEPGSMGQSWEGHECSTPQDDYFDVAREALEETKEKL